MSSFCKSYSHFFSKNISLYAIFNDQSFNDTLTNNIVTFEQPGPEGQTFWIQIRPDVLSGLICSKLFAKVFSRRQKQPLAGKIIKQFLAVKFDKFLYLDKVQLITVIIT